MMTGNIAVYMFMRPRGPYDPSGYIPPFMYVSYELAPYAGGTENIDKSRETIEDFLTFH
jgi:hypothetical protein